MSLRALTRNLHHTLTLTPRITTTTTLHPINRFFTTTSSNMGVQKTVLVEGSGPSPQKGDTVTMLYTGWLKEAGKKDGKGKQFDTTEKPGRGPFKTPIGVGRVIQGEFFRLHQRPSFCLSPPSRMS
jgi:FK506-binding protein 1